MNLLPDFFTLRHPLGEINFPNHIDQVQSQIVYVHVDYHTIEHMTKMHQTYINHNDIAPAQRQT